MNKWFAVLAAASCLIVFGCQADQARPSDEQLMRDLAQSHIDGNVPAGSDFDKFLKRDLTAYFVSRMGKGTTVTYDFLRNGPTQTGIAFPKYYVWVHVSGAKNRKEEGALTLAAVETKKFLVRDYLTKGQIEGDPKAIDEIFPQPVCDRIRDLIN